MAEKRNRDASSFYTLASIVPSPDLRQRAELALHGDEPKLDTLSLDETQRLFHELRVHQVELDMQNDELRLAYAQLEASHDRYADLYDFAPVGYLTLNEAGTIQEANLTLASWLGLDRSKLVGRAFSSFVSPTDQDMAYLHYKTLLETGNPQHNEIRLLKQDGIAFFVRLDSTLRDGNPDQPKIIRTTLIDVTERKAAEAALLQSYAEMETKVRERTADLAMVNFALHESEDRLRFAMDVADICYWVWNTETNLLRWGGPHEALFALTDDDAIDTYETLLQHIYPADRQLFRDTMDRLLGGGASHQVEFRIRWQNDETRWVSVQGQAYQSASSGPFCVLGVMQDITERKQNEQSRAELLRTTQIARDLAEQATQVKTQFLGMVSHELRTPLTSIKGFTTTLLAHDNQFDTKSQREFLEIINQETDMLTDLVEHLLDLSQLQAGALKVARVPVSVDVIMSFGRPQFEALTTRHELMLPASFDLPLVFADPVRVAQVITNLISNSVKHSPPNSLITVSASQSNDFIRISVRDQGSGIPMEQRQTVFQAFEQLETQSRLPSGVGLGLAISKSIIEAHGGRIWVEDQVEVGTTIVCTLPIVSEGTVSQ